MTISFEYVVIFWLAGIFFVLTRISKHLLNISKAMWAIKGTMKR